MVSQLAPAPPASGSASRAALAAWPIAAVFMLGNVGASLYVVWQAEFGFSKSTLTAIFCWYMVGLAASLLVSGVASDRLGRKAVLIPALGLAVVAAVVFATAQGVAALSIARVLTGLATGGLVSAGTAAVTDLAGAERRRLAALLGSIAVAAGTGIGPLWGGLLSETLPGPTSTVFWIQIALLLTAIAVVAKMPLERPATAGAGSWIRVPRVPAAAKRRLLVAVAIAGPGLATTSFMLSLAPSLLTEQLGTDNRVIAGAVAAVAFTTSILSQIALKRLSVDRLLLASAAGTILTAAALIAAVATAATAVLLLSAVFAGAAQGLGLLGGLSLLNQAVPATGLAEANAALNISIYALAGGLSLGLGYLSDVVGLGTAIDDFAVALAVLTLGGLALTRWARA